ncbi:pteridine reductase [Saccharophagus degradans]|uniref:pteridine reductase n=1 Tax=Saccharophagus degradans TaxID=86304 RepID=UPI001C0A5E19|nr:pteridine reductase [Saccharophagus degradans]MBU2984876.1 pteridine reductase [Saccharophagus degradans]
MSTQPPVALITGGARRIGATIATTLHNAGFNIVLHYNRSASEAEQLAAQLNNLRADSVICLQAQLSHTPSVNKLAEAALAKWQRCDVLINNASSFYPTPVGTATEQHWDDLFASNAKAPFFLAQALAPQLKAVQGSIINIADIHAYRPLAQHTIYCMAKAANIMLTQSLACELAPEVRVNGIAPGAIMWPEDKNGNEIENPTRLATIPAKKIGGPQAIADAVLFLVEKAGYCTGEIIKVDGGASLR